MERNDEAGKVLRNTLALKYIYDSIKTAKRQTGAEYPKFDQDQKIFDFLKIA